MGHPAGPDVSASPMGLQPGFPEQLAGMGCGLSSENVLLWVTTAGFYLLIFHES